MIPITPKEIAKEMFDFFENIQINGETRMAYDFSNIIKEERLKLMKKLIKEKIDFWNNVDKEIENLE